MKSIVYFLAVLMLATFALSNEIEKTNFQSETKGIIIINKFNIK